MPKPRDYHLKKRDLQALEAAIRYDKRPEVRQRCTAIRLLHLGHKPEQVAEKTASLQESTRQAIEEYVDFYNFERIQLKTRQTPSLAGCLSS